MRFRSRQGRLREVAQPLSMTYRSNMRIRRWSLPLLLAFSLLEISALTRKAEAGEKTEKKIEAKKPVREPGGEGANAPKADEKAGKRPEKSPQPWFSRAPFLTAVAAILAAIGGMVAAIRKSGKKND